MFRGLDVGFQDGAALPVTDRNADIPLASTETPGEYGNAGLVRCMFEEFS